MSKVYLKVFLKKLKSTCIYKDLINNFSVVALFFLLLTVSINCYFVSIILFLYLYYIKKKNKNIFKVAIFLSILFLVSFLIVKISYKEENSNFVTGKVLEVEEKETYQRILIKTSIYAKKIIYDYDFLNVVPGDIINVEGVTIDITTNRIENAFDYKEYLKHNYINQVIQSEKLEVIKKTFTFRIIKYYLYEYLKIYPINASSFIKGVVLGDDSLFEEDLSRSIRINGISHLFAVSGLHINALIIFVSIIFNKLKLRENSIIIVNTIILIIYNVITSFLPSILRASLLYLFSVINKKLTLGFKSSDVLSIIYILLLIVNPNFMYNIGFCLSFIVTFFIILASPIIKNKTNIKQMIYISIGSQVVTFPFIINLSNQINLFSFFINVIYIVLFSSVIFPCALLSLVVFPFSFIFEYIVISFSKITIFSSSYLSMLVTFPSLKTEYMIVFYGLLFIATITFKRKKIYSYLFLTFIAFLYISPYLSSSQEVYFLDLFDGEAVYIKDSHKNCEALIDSGNDEDIVNKFLLSKGVRHLDFLILTHNHVDHNGGAKYILESIKVKNIVLSEFDTSIYGNYNNTVRVKKGDTIKCGKLEFVILSPSQRSSDENDNSLVIYSKIGLKLFLFLGDASKNIEEDLLNFNINVDVIKIAHHGSTTSTSPLLIDKLRPKYAVIMSGRNKKFNFPSKIVTDTLDEYNVTTFITKRDYSIKYQYKNKKEKFIILNQ